MRRNVPSSWVYGGNISNITVISICWEISVSLPLSVGLEQKKTQPSTKGLLTKCENSSDLSVENVISNQIYPFKGVTLQVTSVYKMFECTLVIFAQISQLIFTVFEPSAPFLWSLFSTLISAECLLTK